MWLVMRVQDISADSNASWPARPVKCSCSAQGRPYVLIIIIFMLVASPFVVSTPYLLKRLTFYLDICYLCSLGVMTITHTGLKFKVIGQGQESRS